MRPGSRGAAAPGHVWNSARGRRFASISTETRTVRVGLAFRSGSRGRSRGPGGSGSSRRWLFGGGKKESILKQYGRNLTAQARKGTMDPVIGREAEMNRMIEILMRRTKNNPILVGSAGVGKTAVVEGLAQRIARGEVPAGLKDKQIVSLSLPSMIAGTKYRGEFEERIQRLIKEVRQAGNVVLFVDEVHMVLGAGGAVGALDAANLLKPVLARGQLKMIGATTWEEYRRYFSNDKTLYRRFQPVDVDEPTVEDAVQVLMGLRDKYEEFHGLAIDDAALEAAVGLSKRFISNRFLPDKAIDLMDESMAKAKVRRLMPPMRIRELRRRLEEIRGEREALPDDAASEEILTVASREADVREELMLERRKWHAELRQTRESITADQIADVIAQWTGIPIANLKQSDKERFRGMEEALARTIVGQGEILGELARSLRRAAAGLKDTSRPIGVFLFVGPSGVGKTESAKALAEFVLGSAEKLVRIDMSEYSEPYTTARLIGAPPGYVGHDDPGQLTEAVRREPYTVILFDEIDKAHPAVRAILLQVMEDGQLTDSTGKQVDFRNTILILTSNTANTTAGSIGFGASDAPREFNESAKERLLSRVRRDLPAEFINRIDRLMAFKPLEEADFREIGRRMLSEVAGRARDQGAELSFKGEVLEELVRRTLKANDGARPLRLMIEVEIEQPLANALIESQASSSMIEAVCEDGDIELMVLDAAEGAVDEEVASAG